MLERLFGLKLQRDFDWVTLLFLVLTPIFSALLVPFYFMYFDFTWPILGIGLFFAAASSMSITAGYHRLFAHKSYQTRPWVRALLLLFGAGTFQGTALKWCSEHRRHHRVVDTNEDPYSIRKGFWYAHIGWLFLKEAPCYANHYDEDLRRDWMIAFQHKHYLALSIFMGFALPHYGWMDGR